MIPWIFYLNFLAKKLTGSETLAQINDIEFAVDTFSLLSSIHEPANRPVMLPYIYAALFESKRAILHFSTLDSKPVGRLYQQGLKSKFEKQTITT